MRSLWVVALSLVVFLSLLSGTAVANANTPPLADAGLDQEVVIDGTVHLDANGSRDPDGTITGFQWSIETPDGTTRSPDCGTCRETAFSPSEVGQYNVTVAVTDDDGVTRSDTLIVDVSSAGGPSVSLSAPSVAVTDSNETFSATATAGDAPLESQAWVVDGTAENRTRLSGDDANVTYTHSFDSPGNVSVRAVTYDTAGRRAVANSTVTVVDTSGGGGGGGGGNSCSGGSGGYYKNGQFMGCTSGAMTIGDTVVDVDSRPGLWGPVGGETVQLLTEDEVREHSVDEGGKVFTKETVDQLREENKEKVQEEQESSGGGGSGSDSGSDSDSSPSNSDSSPGVSGGGDSDDGTSIVGDGGGGGAHIPGSTGGDDDDGGSSDPTGGGWVP